MLQTKINNINTKLKRKSTNTYSGIAQIEKTSREVTEDNRPTGTQKIFNVTTNACNLRKMIEREHDFDSLRGGSTINRNDFGISCEVVGVGVES